VNFLRHACTWLMAIAFGSLLVFAVFVWLRAWMLGS
jgi:hypothetical protein